MKRPMATVVSIAVVLGPGFNIKRHPAGGRCFEYLSEDPVLSGKLAARSWGGGSRPSGATPGSAAGSGWWPKQTKAIGRS